MFDESKEPVDIFADVDTTPKPGQAAPGQPGGGGAAAAQAMATERRGPSKLIFIVVAIVVLGAIGGGVWFMMNRGSGPSVPDDGTAPVASDQGTVPDAPGGEAPAPVVPQEPIRVCGDNTCDPNEDFTSCPADCEAPVVCGDNICDPTEDESSCPFDCRPPQPEEPVVPEEPVNLPADSDGDGLSDSQESALGTNPQSADTDSDGLSDREEVQIYGSDPTRPDTDGDGFLDGEEVKNGYNPNGSGRLFDVPRE